MTEFGTNRQKRSPWKYNPVPSDCRSKCVTLNLKSMVEAVDNYPEDFQISPPTDQPPAPIIFLIFEFFANCPFVHSGSPSLQHWLIWCHQKCHAREEQCTKKVVSCARLLSTAAFFGGPNRQKLERRATCVGERKNRKKLNSKKIGKILVKGRVGIGWRVWKSPG